jgi:hypothetical protein
MRMNGIISNLTGVGFIILSKEALINWKPTIITIKETIRAEIYSNRPCPKGCSSSAGLLASLKPTIVIIDDAASDRLLKASAVTAILPEISPIDSFIANKIALTIIPIIPPR